MNNNSESTKDHEIKIVTENPIQIKVVSDSLETFWSKFFKSYLPWVLLVIALFGYLNQLTLLISKPEVYPRLISFSINYGTYSGYDFYNNKIEKKGIKHCYKLALSVRKKPLYFQNIEVDIKFPKDKKIYNGFVYFPKDDKWFSPINEYDMLTIDPDEFLDYATIIEEGEAKIGYLTIIIEGEPENFLKPNSQDFKSNYEGFEWIRLKFKYNKKSTFIRKSRYIISNRIEFDDINPLNMLYEREIWKPKQE